MFFSGKKKTQTKLAALTNNAEFFQFHYKKVKEDELQQCIQSEVHYYMANVFNTKF